MAQTARNVMVPIVCALSCLTTVSPGHAAEDATRYDLNILRQPLASALQALARQTHLQIIFFSAVTAECDAVSLSGRFTPTEALQRLLDDSPLNYREINSKTIEVFTDNNKVDANHSSPEENDMSKQPSSRTHCAKSLSSLRSAAKLVGFSSAIMAAAAASTAHAADPAADTLDEIIVTAQRRVENLQRVSIAMDVLSADDLTQAGVSSATDLGRVAPSVQIGNGGPFTQTYVRGVGTNTRNQFGDPTVSFNQDGVVIDRPNTIGPIFYDLARVEVLKGPQGTLYGRNSTGGAINVISQMPTNELGGYVSAELGNYSTHNINGAFNLPIGDTLALRASGLYRGRHSYLTGGFPEGSSYRDTTATDVRLQMLFRPNEDFSLRVMAESGKEKAPGDSQVFLYPGEPTNGDKWLGSANPEANQALVDAAAAFTLATGRPALYPPARSDENAATVKINNVLAELNWNFGPATLTVVPGYRYASTHSISYDSVTRLAFDEYSKQKSLEARVARAEDAFKWVVGAFYFDNDRKVHNNATLDPIRSVSDSDIPNISSKSWAGFADGTISLAQPFRLLAGVRYTKEKRTVDGTRVDASPTPRLPLNNFLLNNDVTYNATTWRAGAEWDVAQESMMYFTVSRGFKSGGFYTGPAPNDFKPEWLTAYTLGSRNRFLNDKLQVNLEAFYWKYKDNQQSITGFDSNGNIALITVNAGDARLYGFAADLIARLSANDTISFNGEYLDSKFSRFQYVQSSRLDPARTGCSVSAVVAGRVTVDCHGFPLPRAPKTRFRLSYDHNFVFGSGAQITASAAGMYESSKYLAIEYLPQGKVSSTKVFDLDVDYKSATGRYSVGGYVHNIGEEAVYSSGSEHSSVTGFFYGVIGAPRTYGLRSRVNF